MKHSLSLTLIVRNEEVHIPRVLETAHLYADEIVIVDTGSTDRTKEEASKFTDKIYDFLWCDDFAKARNFGIERCTKDFVMWLDADDVVPMEDAQKIQELMEGPIAWDVCFLPYHCSFDAQGNTVYLDRRERIFRNFHDLWFEFPIHECLRWPPHPIRCAWDISHINIYHRNVRRWQSSHDRNMGILLKHLADGPYVRSARMWWQLARYHRDPQESLKACERAIRCAEPTQVIFLGTLYFQKARSHIRLEQHDEALLALKTSISLYPLWREPFFEAGRLYWNQKRYSEALQMFLSAEAITSPSRQPMTDASIYRHEIDDWLSLTYEKLGRYEEALASVRRALEYLPSEAQYLEREQRYLGMVHGSTPSALGGETLCLSPSPA